MAPGQKVFFPLLASCFLCSGLFLQLAWGEYQSRGKRDPFIPLLAADGQRFHPPGLDEGVLAEASRLSLQGIVFEPGGESYALIDGQVVREGEAMGNITVIKVEPNVVTIQKEGQLYQMKLHTAQEEGSNP